MSITCSTAGDLGDLTYLLGILSELPGAPHTLVLRDNGKTHGIQQHHARLKKLVESQPYIKSLELYTGQKIDWPSEEFRYMGRVDGGTLLDAHWRHGAQVLKSEQEIRGTAQWLHVRPDAEYKGRVILARSPRYRNDFFPWTQVAEAYKGRCVFVGLQSEHAEHCRNYGYLPHVQFDNFYDLAAAIAGSDLFIGNQSFPNAINEGLKHDSIQEVCLEIPDCLYARPNAQYCFDGRLKLEGNWTARNVVDANQINRDTTPPGGWKYELSPGNHVSATTLGNLINILRNNGSPATVNDVLNYTAQLLSPQFYQMASRSWLPRIKKAFEHAGIPLDVP